MKLTRLLVCLAFVCSIPLLAADVEVIEQIVAKVNGDIILRSDLVRARQRMVQELRAQGMKGEQLEEAINKEEANVLRDKIDELLLLQQAKQMNLNVDTDVSKYMAQMQLRFGKKDPEEFQKWVQDQTGMSYQDFREQTKNQMLTQRVIGQEVQSKINVPLEDVKKYYEEHKNEFQREDRIFLQEILVSTVGKDAQGIAEAEKKAKSLVARARSGEKFDELAMANSDADSAQQGGQLPPFQKGDLRKEIEAAVWDKERGYVSDPIKIDNGFEIVKVADKHSKGLATFDEVENEIRSKLMGPLFEPQLRDYLSSLREDSFLEIREGWVDTGAVPGRDTSWSDPARLTPQTVTRQEVAMHPRMKRLLFFPVPGTSISTEGKSSSR